MRWLAVLLVLGVAFAIAAGPHVAEAAPADVCPLVEVVEDVEPATGAVASPGAPIAGRRALTAAPPRVASPAHAPAAPPPVPPPER